MCGGGVSVSTTGVTPAERIIFSVVDLPDSGLTGRSDEFS